MTKKLSKLEDILYQTKNDKFTRILYTRVSSLEQKTDRQTVNSSSYDLVVEDKCSGSIPFFEREGGKKIKTFIDMGCKLELDVHFTIMLSHIVTTINFLKGIVHIELNIRMLTVEMATTTIHMFLKEVGIILSKVCVIQSMEYIFKTIYYNLTEQIIRVIKHTVKIIKKC